MTRAYLDHNATTPLAPTVREAVQAYWARPRGIPASRDHEYGWDAAVAIDEGRSAVAALTGAPERGVVFVSGATEALELLVRSCVSGHPTTGRRIVVGATEHPALMAPCLAFRQRGALDVEVLPVSAQGHVDVDVLRAALEKSKPALVAIMAANNEVGTIADVESIAQVVHDADGLLLSDTTQIFGKCGFDPSAVDVAVLSGHKMYGPPGIGALLVYTDAGMDWLRPLAVPGSPEAGLRAGTPNLPGIVGLAEASRLVSDCLDGDVERQSSLRDRLEKGVLSQIADVWINGDVIRRLCNTSNMGFKGIDARAMIRDMHDIAVSTRSACSSGDSRPSHVLKAIGLSDEDAFSCIRFSLGRFTTQEEIDYTIEKVVASAHKLRKLKSLRVN